MKMNRIEPRQWKEFMKLSKKDLSDVLSRAATTMELARSLGIQLQKDFKFYKPVAVMPTSNPKAPGMLGGFTVILNDKKIVEDELPEDITTKTMSDKVHAYIDTINSKVKPKRNLEAYIGVGDISVEPDTEKRTYPTKGDTK